MDFAYTLPPIALLILLFAAMLLAAELGFFAGRWMSRNYELRETPLFSVVEGGVLGLVGLILAFSFSLAVGRFDNRQRLIVAEAGDLRTTYLRSAFLRPDQRAAFRTALKNYANARVDLYANYQFKRKRASLDPESERELNTMWTQLSALVYAEPTNRALEMLAESVNAVIEDGGQQEAALSNHVPAEVGFLLLFVAAVAAGLLGYGFGIHNSERRIMTVIFCLLITMLVYTIFDLDRPQSGFITVNLQPLRLVIATMQ